MRIAGRVLYLHPRSLLRGLRLRTPHLVLLLTEPIDLVVQQIEPGGRTCSSLHSDPFFSPSHSVLVSHIACYDFALALAGYHGRIVYEHLGVTLGKDDRSIMLTRQ